MRVTTKLFCYHLVLPVGAVAAAYYNNRKVGFILPRTIICNKSSEIFRCRNRDYFYALTTIFKSATSSDDAEKTKSTSKSVQTKLSTNADIQHMKLATRYARIGYGYTFPNPAVGCVLVRHADQDDGEDTIIGSGFHPRAGFPHAEVFALFEACGHVEDGVMAARSVMRLDSTDTSTTNAEAQLLSSKILDLLDVYKSEGGASKLFNNHFDDCSVTAYVTLEPCCHFGQTPPCALSLVAAGIDRVVVGYRDPNPKVAGGGIRLLQDAGIDVQVIGQTDSIEENDITSNDEEMEEVATECSDLVKYFVRRISPREEPIENLNDVINGKKRRLLRSIAGRQKSANTMSTIGWPKDDSISSDDKNNSDFAERVILENEFLESIDQSLWDHELVLLRLNNVVHKKKGAKILGGRIAEILNAHVAQVVGHTALLYRPSFPTPILNLDEVAEDDG